MEVETQGYKLYELEFLDGDYIYVGSDIKAKNLEEAKLILNKNSKKCKS